jgi:hypothetical protein
MDQVFFYSVVAFKLLALYLLVRPRDVSTKR